MRRILHSTLAILIAASLLAPAAMASIAPMAMAGHACCHHGAAAHEHCGAGTQAGLSATSDCHDGHGCCLCSNLREPVRVAPAARPDGSAPVVEHPFLEEFFPSAALDSSENSRASRAPPRSVSR